MNCIFTIVRVFTALNISNGTRSFQTIMHGNSFVDFEAVLIDLTGMQWSFSDLKKSSDTYMEFRICPARRRVRTEIC